MNDIRETTVTYLEMRHDPHIHVPPPAIRHALIRAECPPLHFYRYLYDTVGREYFWVDRKVLRDDELQDIIHDPNVEIYVFYAQGCPAGFAELDLRQIPDVELAYFGLLPGYAGRGLGRYFLSQIITIAWSHEPKRLHVQTCSLDHPAALALYQKCGFVAYAQEAKTVAI